MGNGAAHTFSTSSLPKYPERKSFILHPFLAASENCASRICYGRMTKWRCQRQHPTSTTRLQPAEGRRRRAQALHSHVQRRQRRHRQRLGVLQELGRETTEQKEEKKGRSFVVVSGNKRGCLLSAPSQDVYLEKEKLTKLSLGSSSSCKEHAGGHF